MYAHVERERERERDRDKERTKGREIGKKNKLYFSFTHTRVNFMLSRHKIALK